MSKSVKGEETMKKKTLEEINEMLDLESLTTPNSKEEVMAKEAKKGKSSKTMKKVTIRFCDEDGELLAVDGLNPIVEVVETEKNLQKAVNEAIFDFMLNTSDPSYLENKTVPFQEVEEIIGNCESESSVHYKEGEEVLFAGSLSFELSRVFKFYYTVDKPELVVVGDGYSSKYKSYDPDDYEDE